MKVFGGLPIPPSGNAPPTPTQAGEAVAVRETLEEAGVVCLISAAVVARVGLGRPDVDAISTRLSVTCFVSSCIIEYNSELAMIQLAPTAAVILGQIPIGRRALPQLQSKPFLPRGTVAKPPKLRDTKRPI
jgi:hypothetical protein